MVSLCLFYRFLYNYITFDIKISNCKYLIVSITNLAAGHWLVEAVFWNLQRHGCHILIHNFFPYLERFPMLKQNLSFFAFQSTLLLNQDNHQIFWLKILLV